MTAHPSTIMQAKLKIGLDECRMLVLGTQVLISIQFEAPFESAFDQLPKTSQLLLNLATVLLLLALAILLMGPCLHRLANRILAPSAIYRFFNLTLTATSIPLSLAIGIDIFVVAHHILGPTSAFFCSGGMVIVAWSMWYLMGILNQSASTVESIMPDEEQNPTALHEEVSQIMTEARIILPGAQAMLGFQFITTIMRDFASLPDSSKWIHLASLLLTALTVILLIAPAEFHRIADRGKDTPRLVRIAGFLVMAALVPLALSITGDFYVVTRKITHSPPLALISSTLLCLTFFSLWFGYGFYQRRMKSR